MRQINGLDPSHHNRDQQVSAAEDIEVQEKEEEDFEEDNEVNTEVKSKLPSLQAFRGKRRANFTKCCALNYLNLGSANFSSAKVCLHKIRTHIKCRDLGLNLRPAGCT